MSNQTQGVAQRVMEEINKDLDNQWRAMVWGETSDELLEGAERMHAELSAEARRVLAEMPYVYEWEGEYTGPLLDDHETGIWHMAQESMAKRLGLVFNEPEDE